MRNERSLDALCAALAYAMGIEPPRQAEAACEELIKFVDEKLGGRKADRVFMYNPDAIGQWVYEKYADVFKTIKARAGVEIPFCSVVPPVTPVCFATMYTGAQPEVHGIRKYEKPVLRIDTLFDALIRAGKKPVIVGYGKCSLTNIYLEREMDYFVYDSVPEVNAKAAELILQDEYDFIVVYNGNFDSTMHHNGPESAVAIGELGANAMAFSTFAELIKKHWKNHDTLMGFAMDHGCHEIDSGGSHGLDIDEDMNIVHLYEAYPKR